MSHIRVKQISNSGANSGSVIAFDGTVNLWQKINHIQTIEVGDLDANGVMVINHDLGKKFVHVTVYNEDDAVIVPDLIKAFAINEVHITLQSFMATGLSWTVTVS